MAFSTLGAGSNEHFVHAGTLTMSVSEWAALIDALLRVTPESVEIEDARKPHQKFEIVSSLMIDPASQDFDRSDFARCKPHPIDAPEGSGADFAEHQERELAIPMNAELLADRLDRGMQWLGPTLVQQNLELF